MLVYPIEHRLDQHGNARRVAHHHLGLTGSIKHDTTPNIKEKIQTLLYNASFLEKLKTIKTECSKCQIPDTWPWNAFLKNQ